jgi:hypothetical protein
VRAKGDRRERQKKESCSLSFADRGEREGLKKKNDVAYLFFFVNLSYFTMDLLYWDLILEALRFYRKIFWALF